MQIFQSKIDRWLLMVLWLSGFISFAAAVAIVILVGGLATVLAAVFTVIVGVGLPYWIVNSTRYQVSANELIISSGPFRWRIERSSITGVEDTTNPLSSPALSLDRLKIHYGEGRFIMVSPADKALFKKAIGMD